MWRLSKQFFSGFLSNTPRDSSNSAKQKWETQPVLNLSDRQIDLIRQSWTDDFGQMYELGSAIFDHLVECQPEIETVFASTFKKAQVCRKDLHYFFLQFIQLLTVAVSNLRSPKSVLDPLLLQVGKLHHRLVPNGFKPEHFDGFAQATFKAMDSHLRRKNATLSDTEVIEICNAWVPLCDYMVGQMKMGFYSGSDKTRRN